MPTAASPRHPWKALAVVLLVFAVVHAGRAHAVPRDRDATHIHVVHADRDCDGLRIDLDDEPDGDPAIDAFDDDDWS